MEILPREPEDQFAQRLLERRPPGASCAGTSNVGQQAGDASPAASLASPGSSSTLLAAASDSAPLIARGQLEWSVDGRSAGAGPPTRGAAPRSPAPSSDATGPAVAQVRTGSGRRDRRTTRASTGLPTRRRRERRHYPGRPVPPTKGACEFANPTPANGPVEQKTTISARRLAPFAPPFAPFGAPKKAWLSGKRRIEGRASPRRVAGAN
jgi:hypothetical protein